MTASFLRDLVAHEIAVVGEANLTRLPHVEELTQPLGEGAERALWPVSAGRAPERHFSMSPSLCPFRLRLASPPRAGSGPSSSLYKPSCPSSLLSWFPVCR